MKNKFYLTTPIYYANDKPHIGHAFATLYADVIARYQKLRGRSVLFTTGTDEHGSKIEEKARGLKKDPQEWVDEVALLYQKTWQSLGIQYDIFIRTTSKQHKKGVLDFIKRLYQNSDIYPDFYKGLYCPDCEDFVTEKELTNDGLCPNHLKLPQKIKEKNYFFQLQKYLPLVREKILKNELKIVPESRRNEILNIIEAGMPDFSITREKVKWGIPFPYLQNQTIYVWVDALINYLTALNFSGNKFKKFWPPDLQIIGVDINKFHSIFWPALLLSVKLPLPKTIFVHGLFTINGQKMSKSLGNIIDPLDLITQFGADAVRYLLLSQFPAIEHGDIKESEFKLKYNTDLANGIGNLLERIITMIVNYRKKYSGLKRMMLDKYIINLGEEFEKNYIKHMENYELFYGLQSIFSFIKSLDRYIETKKPWILNENRNPKLDEVLSSLLWGIEKIIDWLEPFIPSKISTVRNYISQIKKGEIGGKKNQPKLNLFPRIKE